MLIFQYQRQTTDNNGRGGGKVFPLQDETLINKIKPRQTEKKSFFAMNR